MEARLIAFNVVDAAPSRIGAIFGTFITACAAAWPQSLRDWMDWLMTPDQIRIVGIAGFVLFLAYWVLWFYLRPKSTRPEQESPPHEPGTSIDNSGDGIFDDNEISIPGRLDIVNKGRMRRNRIGPGGPSGTLERNDERQGRP